MAFICQTCEKSFVQRCSLNRHRREVHETPSTMHNCVVCAKKYNRKSKLDEHVSTKHAKRTANLNLMECADCGKKLPNRQAMLYHTRTHINNKAHACGKCGKSFRDSHRRNNHQNYHCGEPQLVGYSPPRIDVGEPMDVDEPAMPQPDPSSTPMPILQEGPGTSGLHSPQPGPSTSHPPSFTSPRPGPSSAASSLPSPQPGPSAAAPSLPPQQTSSASSNGPQGNSSFRCTERAFKNRLKTYELRRRPSGALTMQEFFVFVFEHLIHLLVGVLQEFRNVKVNVFVECEFRNVKGATCTRNFKTKNTPLTHTSDLGQFCSDIFDKLLHEKERCEMSRSNWSYSRILTFEVRVNKYNPLRGSSHIRLPANLRNNKKGLVNTMNNDSRCFLYAMLARFVTRPEDPRSFTPADEARFNWAGVRFPMALTDIPAFEKNNVGVSINVYGIDKCRVGEDDSGKPIFKDLVFPLKVCDRELGEHFDLLYLRDGNTSHYVYIRDFSRLVRPQLTTRYGHVSICKRCFAYFDNRQNKLGLNGEERLAEHRRYCSPGDPVRMDLASDPTISFQHPERTQRARFCIYADFESLLKPVSNPTPDPDNSFTVPKQIHEPYSYTYLFKDTHGEFSETRMYRGPDAAKHFLTSLKSDAAQIGDILYLQRQMKPVLNREEQAAFQSATSCYLCGKEFTDVLGRDGKPKDPKVRDHSHAAPYSYRGAAHRSCNLRYHEQDTINVYFHNLSKYDAHFVVRELGLDEENIDVIANTQETYISFTKSVPYKYAKHGRLRLRFVDTFRFMPSSISKLAANLPTDLLHHTQMAFPNPDEFELLCRKGVFPYDHITSMEVLNETQLPPKEIFFNSLTLEHISDADYCHAQNVWDKFGIQTLGEYSDLYNRSDVLLLADIFENFRDMCIREYKLDPAHYITLPSFAWDVMLQMTGVKLDTIQDFDQYLFFEKGIRGGITQCCTRHAQANNKYCKEFKRTEPSQYIIYLDANNLYGYALSQPLPTGDFQWLNSDEIKMMEIDLIGGDLNVDGDRGYIFEVDLSYPHQLHDRHRDFPFCAQSSIPPNGKFPKLMTTLTDKTNYIIHGKTLKQALDKDLVLTKIHRVLSFRQSAWLKVYIDHNTRLRTAACNAFEKDLFKLMNNAVFGKSCENVRKHIDVRLVSSEIKFDKLVARSTFVDRTLIAEDLALVNLAKARIVLDKPLYIGMCVLELSKWLMYNFHYDVMLNKYGNRLKLLYTDTDSLVYLIRSADIYQEMTSHIDDFDTSDYPPDHKLFRTMNKKVIGKFKDEVNGRIITEFVGLRAKLYCMKFEDEGGNYRFIKRAKGVSRAVVDKELSIDDYKNCLIHRTDHYTLNTQFQSRNHNVSTVQVNKLSLSPYDDKRHILAPDFIHTLPHGHKDIPNP